MPVSSFCHIAFFTHIKTNGEIGSRVDYFNGVWRHNSNMQLYIVVLNHRKLLTLKIQCVGCQTQMYGTQSLKT